MSVEMVQGLEVDRLIALLGKCLGYASIFGVAAFFYRMYQMRMLLRRAQRDHGVVCNLGISLQECLCESSVFHPQLTLAHIAHDASFLLPGPSSCRC